MSEPIRFFLPGPTYVLDAVRDAMTAPSIGHRGAPFKELYADVQQPLRTVFRTRGEVLLASSSATLVLEATVNLDAVTALVLPQVNTPPFTDFLGLLDAHGNGQAVLQTGALGPGAVGLVLDLAYLLWDPFDFVSNPAAVQIVP